MGCNESKESSPPSTSRKRSRYSSAHRRPQSKAREVTSTTNGMTSTSGFGDSSWATSLAYSRPGGPESITIENNNSQQKPFYDTCGYHHHSNVGLSNGAADNHIQHHHQHQHQHQQPQHRSGAASRRTSATSGLALQRVRSLESIGDDGCSGGGPNTGYSSGVGIPSPYALDNTTSPRVPCFLGAVRLHRIRISDDEEEAEEVRNDGGEDDDAGTIEDTSSGEEEVDRNDFFERRSSSAFSSRQQSTLRCNNSNNNNPNANNSSSRGEQALIGFASAAGAANSSNHLVAAASRSGARNSPCPQRRRRHSSATSNTLRPRQQKNHTTNSEESALSAFDPAETHQLMRTLNQPYTESSAYDSSRGEFETGTTDLRVGYGGTSFHCDSPTPQSPFRSPRYGLLPNGQ